MKEYKKYVLGGVFACFMAVALMAPAGKSEAFWPFGKAKKENNANYTGAVANTESDKIKPIPSITVVSPNGGEVLKAGKPYAIKWKTRGLSKKVQLSISLEEFFKDGSVGYTTIINSTKNTGVYKWKVPNIYGSNVFKILVNAEVRDESDDFFSISQKTKKNIAPEIMKVSIEKTESGDEIDIKAGDSVSLIARAYDANDDDLSWGVDWGDGTGMVGACEVDHKQNKKGWEFETQHIWKEKGTYTVDVTVSDCRGGSDKDATNINIESI